MFCRSVVSNSQNKVAMLWEILPQLATAFVDFQIHQFDHQNSLTLLA